MQIGGNCPITKPLISSLITFISNSYLDRLRFEEGQGVRLDNREPAAQLDPDLGNVGEDLDARGLDGFLQGRNGFEGHERALKLNGQIVDRGSVGGEKVVAIDRFLERSKKCYKEAFLVVSLTFLRSLGALEIIGSPVEVQKEQVRDGNCDINHSEELFALRSHSRS